MPGSADNDNRIIDILRSELGAVLGADLGTGLDDVLHYAVPSCEPDCAMDSEPDCAMDSEPDCAMDSEPDCALNCAYAKQQTDLEKFTNILKHEIQRVSYGYLHIITAPIDK